MIHQRELIYTVIPYLQSRRYGYKTIFIGSIFIRVESAIYLQHFEWPHLFISKIHIILSGTTLNMLCMVLRYRSVFYT